jgi:hypothetical protein
MDPTDPDPQHMFYFQCAVSDAAPVGGEAVGCLRTGTSRLLFLLQQGLYHALCCVTLQHMKKNFIAVKIIREKSLDFGSRHLENPDPYPGVSESGYSSTRLFF